MTLSILQWSCALAFTTSTAVNALTPSLPPRAVAVLYLDPAEVQLSEAHKAIIDEQVGILKGGGCANWPERSEASVTYYLSPATLPRQDYQRIGSQLETLRGHLKSQYKFQFVPVLIAVRDTQWNAGQPDEQILIDFNCPRA